ncbi:MAG TPA: C39 family peptidase [Jatrophihabitans sp.]|nr:C39 family peptidase [Jatrophihabitans sp.]
MAATTVAVAAPAHAAPSAITLPHTTVAQSNGWACGPYATHIALTTFGWGSSISQLESLEHTSSSSGTNSVANVTTALNYFMSAHGVLLRYKSVYPDGSTATVKHYLVNDIYGGNGFVANIVGYRNDVNGVSRGYGYGGHYVAVVGYRDNGDQARIADPGDGQDYWMTTANLAGWIGTARGISVTP